MVVDSAAPGGGAEGDDAVLADLLRAMISGTHWCYAEMWVPGELARRYLVAAAYARPGRGPGMLALESLSRALALRPGECLLRHAPPDGSISASCVQEVALSRAGLGAHAGSNSSSSSPPLAASPRAFALRDAGIASALSFALVDGGRQLAVVVLLSQRGPATSAAERSADAMHLEQLYALSTTAIPYLALLERTRNGARECSDASEREPRPQALQQSTYLDDSGASLLADNDASDSSILDEKQTRSPITYKSPMRRKFNSVSESIRPKQHQKTHSPSTSKLGVHGAASLAVEYQVAIAEALRKFPRHENGKPHALRVSALWTIFEQLCEVPWPMQKVLEQMRFELKAALFSDDLMSADDGLSLIRVPFFDQVEYRKLQLAESEEKAAQLQQKIEKLLLAQSEMQEKVEEDIASIAQLKRKAFLSDRRLVKMKLLTFFKRKGMADEIRKEQAERFESLQREISELRNALKAEQDKSRYRFVEDARDIDLLDTMLETLDASCSRPPSMLPVLTGPPAGAAASGDKGEKEVSTGDELRAMQEQMLMLRNANLTYYECERAVVDEAVQDEKYGFLRTMEELESEILELDDARSTGAEFGAAYSRYKDMLSKIYDDNTECATTDLFSAASASKAARQAAEDSSSHDGARPDNAVSPTQAKQLAASAISKRKYVVGRIHSEHCTTLDGSRSRGQGWMVEDVDAEEEDSSFWVQKGAQSQADINLFKMWNIRAIGQRERVRELDLKTVLAWVYDVLQRKASADALLSQNDTSVRYLTVEETFYEYLEDKYCSSHLANLAAKDILTLVDEARGRNKLLQLFASVMSRGGWFDSDWKYVLRVQQFVHSMFPAGFPNIGAVENFLIRHFYPDLPRPEIERVMEMLKHFAAYNRAVAQRGELSAKDGRKMGPKGLGADEHAQDKQAAGVRSRRHSSEALAPHHAHSQMEEHHVLRADTQESSPDGADAADAVRGGIPSAVLSEFVASMLEQEQEPRLKKMLIMSQVDGLDAPDAPMSYAAFETFAAKCNAGEVAVAACQQSYRMLLKAYPDRKFPAASLSMCVATLELDMLLRHRQFQPSAQPSANPFR